ncbi:MAG: hypothetical protein KIT69_09305 [Propionibacteriaceae bacterium]|nr:hypothetical protein [Propionibacteriaceae bacterium]
MSNQLKGKEMTTVRRIIAATVAAGALALSMGIAQADAAAVNPTTKTGVVVAAGGGQGSWPLAK